MVTATSQPLSAGNYIDSFKIESVIGTGGFGITYRAFDDNLQRTVAIKEYYPAGLAVRAEDATTLSPRTHGDVQAYGYGLQRFLDEARTLAKFDQPNIVRVNRFLQANGTAYLVMDYEQGQPLADVLRRMNRLNHQQAKAVATHILTGLRAMHDKRYLHRDIKPGNVLIRKSGPPVLLDFGAARMALEQQTGAMTVMLTPGYAPVEQYSGEEQQGPWSDIYALGATIYHCMTGGMPVASTDRLGAILQGKRDPLEAGLERVAGDFKPAFVETVWWMLRPQAADRPQHAESVLNRLKAGVAPAESRSAHATPAAALPEASKDALAPELVEKAEAELAAFIGPIARVIVRRAGEKARGPDEFRELLAAELEDDTERQSFLRSLD